MVKLLRRGGVLSVICLLGTSVMTMAGGEKVVYDSRGKAHRIPDIEYQPPAVAYGIIPQISKIQRPLELINPLAPASYGNGQDMFSVDPASGKPKGFIAAGLRFW